MPKPLKKTLDEWDALMSAVRENEHSLPGVGPFFNALLKARAQILKSRMRRDTAFVAAIHLARQARESFEAGQEAAAALRSFLLGVLGRRSEKLRLYGLKPLRPRESGTKRARRRAHEVRR